MEIRTCVHQRKCTRSTISDNQTQEAAQRSTHGIWHGNIFIPGMLIRIKTLKKHVASTALRNKSQVAAS